jgi:uncharacterized protein (DUF1501 family)
VPASQRRDFIAPLHSDSSGGTHVSPADGPLVVVFLRGGADGLTLVPPVGDDDYHRSRPLLGLAPSQTIDLDGYFALNRRLEKLLPFYRQGELAIIHGAGSSDRTRSHFSAQDTMEHGGAWGSGWLARYLRARNHQPTALSAVAIGTKRPESLRGAPAGAVLQTLGDFDLYRGPQDDDSFFADLDRLYADAGEAMRTAATQTLSALERLRLIDAGAKTATANGQYPDTPFGRGLHEIASLIRAEVGLVASTIDLDGWDTHFLQADIIDGLMDQLAHGLAAFMDDLGPQRQQVSVVVLTEFGRRLQENASFGTDHGAGGVLMLLGRTPLAGRVVSPWRSLEASHRDEVGDVPVGFDFRDALAPLLARHAPGIDLGQVFPSHTFAPELIKDTADG